MILRRIVFAVVTAAFMATGVGASQAGGSSFEPSDVRVEAGEDIELVAKVDHRQPDPTEAGPYFVYLQGNDFGEVVAEGENGGASTDVLLCELVLDTSTMPL